MAPKRPPGVHRHRDRTFSRRRTSPPTNR